jgi:N-acetylgalactosamine kinase
MPDDSSISKQSVVVVLAAGKGTRMGRDDLVKVCFEIDGVPAVNRQIGVFKKEGFRRFVLVVGSHAEQVLDAVNTEHPGVAYVYQNPPKGTGHAARVAADALQNLGYQGHVLVTAGDNYLETEAIEALVSGYVRQQADLALLTVPITRETEGSVGRVFVDPSGRAVDIIERVDLARQAIVDELQGLLAGGAALSGEDLAAVIDRHLPNPKKQKVAVGELLDWAGRGGRIDRAKLAGLLDSDKYHLAIEGKRYTARQIEKTCTWANQSLYLFSSEAFYHGVGMIRNDNAQGEFYLTDVVRLLSAARDAEGKPRYRVRAVALENPDHIQGFNSPDELVAIQDYVRRRKVRQEKPSAVGERPRLSGRQYATVRDWLGRIESPRPAVARWMRSIYGDHQEVHEQKAKDLKATIECYGRRFGMDEKVCIVRAPGRINLMGRHVDHRGGMTNFLAIDRETMAVVGLREDDSVLAVNTEPKKFPAIEFRIAELIGQFAWSEWIDFVNSDWVRSMLYAAPGDWGHYIKAAILRLQHQFQDVKVRGINMALSGDVPIAAGLSSSSTIVVATLQAATALNGFELTSQQFVDLCGEGEWFVGSRGGAGDHAAIYLGRRGQIAHVGYHPFRVEKIIEAPADYQVIIADSLIKAKKSKAAKHTFNARVADYNLGFALLRQRCPEFSRALEYVRDIDPARLGCATSDVYRMLLKVPERMTRKQYRALLSQEYAPLADANFATHDEPESYTPRGVLLYGAAECVRSRLAIDLLEAEKVETFGQIMQVSHDGDRVSRPGSDGAYRRVPQDSSDEALERLILDLASEDPERVLRAQLYMQPGSYACSTPEIDQMVDIASRVPGVAGAQIAGAGLGGCIMVLARKDVVEAVRKALAAHYYRPAGLKPAILPCIAVEGAGLVEF